MATPTLGSLPTTIDPADSTTNWTLYTTLDTAFDKDGGGSVSGIMRNDLAVGYYDNGGGASAINLTGQHVRVWINFSTVSTLDIEANNGMEFFMYDGTNTAYWVAFGSDTYSGGWKNYVLDCDSTPDSGSYDKTIVQRWGFRFNRISAPANKINTWVDYVRYGDGYYATGGTSGDEITLTTIQAVDLTNAYGIIELFEGVFFSYGELTIGNGATTTWFEMLSEVLVFTNSAVASGLYGIIGAGSGCRITIDGSVLRGAGSTDLTRFAIDMSDTNIASCVFTDNFINRAAASIFNSGQTVTGNTFVDCGQITHGRSDMSNCNISSYEGTANTSAMIYNVNADPDGYTDDMLFVKGTAATHAIEFGTTSPLTMTVRNMAVTGYNASNNQNDSTFHIKRTSGTVTINLINCTGTYSYRTDGATVNLAVSVTVTVTVVDTDNAPIQNAQTSVHLVSDGSEVINADTDSSGIVTTSFSGTTPADCYIRIRKGSTGATKYIANSTTGTIQSGTGLSVTIVMQEDPNNAT
jgi:hypothetical protein